MDEYFYNRPHGPQSFTKVTLISGPQTIRVSELETVIVIRRPPWAPAPTSRKGEARVEVSFEPG